MKFACTKPIIGMALLALSASANATLVTETWESTITSINHTAFNIGDTFSWTVTYDNAAQRFSQYHDGAK